MTVKELIEALKQYDENADVVVQYRDDGGVYYGTDSDIEPFLNEYGEVVL